MKGVWRQERRLLDYEQKVNDDDVRSTGTPPFSSSSSMVWFNPIFLLYRVVLFFTLLPVPVLIVDLFFSCCPLPVIPFLVSSFFQLLLNLLLLFSLLLFPLLLVPLLPFSEEQYRYPFLCIPYCCRYLVLVPNLAKNKIMCIPNQYRTWQQAKNKTLSSASLTLTGSCP